MVLDIIVILLLTVTLAYGVRLSKKLDGLRKNRQEFSVMIETFDHAVLKAEQHLAEIRKITHETIRDIDKKTEHAAITIDNMQYMIEKCHTTIEQLRQQLVENTSARPSDTTSKKRFTVTAAKPQQDIATERAPAKEFTPPKAVDKAIINLESMPVPPKEPVRKDEKTRVIASLMERIAQIRKDNNVTITLDPEMEKRMLQSLKPQKESETA